MEVRLDSANRIAKVHAIRKDRLKAWPIYVDNKYQVAVKVQRRKKPRESEFCPTNAVKLKVRI